MEFKKNLEEEFEGSKVRIDKFELKLVCHPEIENAFSQWVRTRKYDTELKIEGYSANDIHKLAPFMDGLEVHNFLISLAENPKGTKRWIQKGFPKK